MAKANTAGYRPERTVSHAPNIIHVEGLPGAGKSTAARQFCQLLNGAGVDAYWWQEGAPDHPITQVKSHTRLDHTPELPQLYIDDWREFAASNRTTAVFDGYALQSTVRFLYANRFPRDQIESYFKQWQLLATETTLIYLTVDNPVDHYHTVCAERGNDWSKKLYAYVEHTPIGMANSMRGHSGFVEFWSNYQRLCLELLDTAIIRVYTLQARTWINADLKAIAGKAGFLPSQ